jgi:hypothetical protein
LFALKGGTAINLFVRDMLREALKFVQEARSLSEFS